MRSVQTYNAIRVMIYPMRYGTKTSFIPLYMFSKSRAFRKLYCSEKVAKAKGRKNEQKSRAIYESFIIMFPKKAVMLLKVVRKNPQENKKNGIASYRMKRKSILMPSTHMSYLFSHVGRPSPPILMIFDVFERYPREKKFATGI